MIDWKRIEDLQDEVGIDDFVEIARMFLDEVEEILASLPDTCDPTSRSEGFHSLKSSALNLGFSQMAQLCSAAESDPVTADSTQIRAIFENSKEILRGRFTAI